MSDIIESKQKMDAGGNRPAYSMRSATAYGEGCRPDLSHCCRVAGDPCCQYSDSRTCATFSVAKQFQNVAEEVCMAYMRVVYLAHAV